MTSENGKVLIVDDDAVNTELLADYLSSRGYTIATSPDGYRAIDRVSYDMPDVMLLDVMMPRMNGFEVCERIKSDPQSSALPVLMITALDGSADRKKAIESGADDFISKPFDFDEVSLRVRNAVRMHQQFVEVSESYQKLRDLQDLRDILTHSILHDVRSPLSGALSLVASLGHGLSGAMNERQAAYFGRVNYSLRMTLEMLASILDVARIESGRFPLEYTRCDVNDVVRNAVTLIGSHGQDTVVHIDVPDGECIADCDRGVIGRVIVNLLDNALKHSQTAGVIRVTLRSDGKAIDLRVADNGHGVPLDLQSGIFEKFVSGPGGQRRRHSAGLGLAFCKLAVEAHGGAIGVNSEPGNGSEFWFSIPTERQSQEKRAA